MNHSKKIIIVGASSGIGAALAELLLKQGHRVALVARREQKLHQVAQAQSENAIIYSHDVAETSQAASVFQQAVDEMGGLDEIYFCAGIMPAVEIDEYNTNKDSQIMQINTLGAIAWLNPAADYFQKQGFGKIIGISSVAGDRGRVGNPVYNTSKAALTTYLEAIRNRLNKKGVSVTTIKPGFIDTEMTRGLTGLFWLISAEKAAQIILQATAKNKSTVYVPYRWQFVMLIIRHIPSFIFKKLSI